MSLFGNKKSTSVSTTDASTSSQSADGLVSSNVINAGGDVTKIDEFSDNVTKFVSEVSNKAIDVATTSNNNLTDIFQSTIFGFGSLVDDVIDFSKDSATETKNLVSQAAQPDIALVKDITQYIPWIIGGALIVVAVAIWKK